MKKITIMTRVLFVAVFIMLVACAVLIPTGIYTNGFEGMRTRYIKVDGTVIKNDGSVQLREKEETVFYLSGAGFKAVDWGEYAVKIEANPGYGIEFTINGNPGKYAGIDLTEYFNVRRGTGCFAISGESAPEKILKRAYGECVVITKQIKPGIAPYIMTVTPTSKKAVRVYLINFTIPPDGIEMPGGDVVVG